jgi:Zn-dependent peptidase ImmA (M78 family)
VDEFTAAMRARAFVRKVNRDAIPVSLEAYIAELGAVLRFETDLETSEPGYFFKSSGKHYICVNANDSLPRQRFTACHKIAHIVLGLPSEHEAMPWWSYAKRSANEIYCDVFAAELLLPHRLFEPLVARAEIGWSTVSELGTRFLVSDTATASRLATVINVPCAFVLSEEGRVRYGSRSRSLRDAGGWISPQAPLPSTSASARARAGQRCQDCEEIAADLWFSDWRRGGVLLEEARHLKQWDQTLTLLWFEDEEIPSEQHNYEPSEEQGLAELDGVLPWPGKRHRR